MNQISDDAIVDQVIGGHVSSFSILVERHKSYVYTIALNILQIEEEAEEVAQDTFVKAYSNINKFNREAKFTTWLYRIAFNTALTAKKKVTRRKAEPLEKEHDLYDTSQSNFTEQKDRKKYISLAMKNLNESDNTALTLFYLEELSLEEICQITDIALSTLKVRLHRARKRFAKELELLLKTEAVNL